MIFTQSIEITALAALFLFINPGHAFNMGQMEEDDVPEDGRNCLVRGVPCAQSPPPASPAPGVVFYKSGNQKFCTLTRGRKPGGTRNKVCNSRKVLAERAIQDRLEKELVDKLEFALFEPGGALYHHREDVKNRFPLGSPLNEWHRKEQWNKRNDAWDEVVKSREFRLEMLNFIRPLLADMKATLLREIQSAGPSSDPLTNFMTNGSSSATRDLSVDLIRWHVFRIGPGEASRYLNGECGSENPLITVRDTREPYQGMRKGTELYPCQYASFVMTERETQIMQVNGVPVDLHRD